MTKDARPVAAACCIFPVQDGTSGRDVPDTRPSRVSQPPDRQMWAKAPQCSAGRGQSEALRSKPGHEAVPC